MVSKPEGKDKYGEELVGPVRGSTPRTDLPTSTQIGHQHRNSGAGAPSGKRIEFKMASADVIHAFWVPEFLFKRDVIPIPANNSGQRLPDRRNHQDRSISWATAPRCVARITR